MFFQNSLSALGPETWMMWWLSFTLTYDNVRVQTLNNHHNPCPNFGLSALSEFWKNLWHSFDYDQKKWNKKAKNLIEKNQNKTKQKKQKTKQKQKQTNKQTKQKTKQKTNKQKTKTKLKQN